MEQQKIDSHGTFGTLLLELLKPFQPVLAGFAWADQAGGIRDLAVDCRFSDISLGFDAIQLGAAPTPPFPVG